MHPNGCLSSIRVHRKGIIEGPLLNARLRYICTEYNEIASYALRLGTFPVWAGNFLCNGLCTLFPVLGLSLNLRNGWNLIPRLCMSSVRIGHTFFAMSTPP